jgi:hypothetical protein
VSEFAQESPDALDQSDTALLPWVGPINRQFSILQDERHGGTGTFIDLGSKRSQQCLNLVPMKPGVQTPDLILRGIVPSHWYQSMVLQNTQQGIGESLLNLACMGGTTC